MISSADRGFFILMYMERVPYLLFTRITINMTNIRKGIYVMYTGNYECLELFVKSDEGKKGSVLLKNVKESTTETKELKHIYGNWIKFPVSRNTEYEISTQDCTITFAI